jgi:NhaP-type Na+/H+ or K+/H+ antiporter
MGSRSVTEAAAFILGGVALALIPGTPDVELDPDLALVLFLPPLFYRQCLLHRDYRAQCSTKWAIMPMPKVVI